MELKLSLLGPFAAWLGGEPLTDFRNRKTQALLIYLVVEGALDDSRDGRPHEYQREQLMDLLWPGLPQPSAQVNLRQSLYQLRQLAPAVNARQGGDPVPLILSDRQTVGLHPESAVSLDVAAFLKGVGSDDIAELAPAAALYRGDFLADFYLPDSETFEAWAAARRAEFRRLTLAALERLAGHHLQQFHYDEAERYARRQLEIDNLRESGHRQLMEALAHSGQRSAALEQYEMCRRILAEELGLEPAPATMNLAERIRQNQLGQPVLEVGDTPLAAPVAEAFPSPVHRLPASATPMIGREAELAALGRFLADPGVRLVTIVGPGGIGKTRLALAVAEREVENFAHGVFFVELASMGSFDDQLLSSMLHFIRMLREGYSMLQAFAMVAERAPEPTASAFRHLVDSIQDDMGFRGAPQTLQPGAQETQLGSAGVSLLDALETLQRQVESTQFGQVVTVIQTQLREGGNLADRLDTLSESLQAEVGHHAWSDKIDYARNLIVAAIAGAVSYQFQQGRRDQNQQILDYLRGKTLCLVLDNFEHLIDGANLLTDILQAAPQVKILVTSREPLRLYEEQVFPVSGLAFTEAMVTMEEEAVQLFQQRACRLRPDFALHEADIPHMTKICRQVGGMPLALELAAAWVDALPLADIAGELEQSLDLLETAWRSAPDRHHSMRAVFEASWQRLPDEKRQIFSRLSVFRGGFTRAAAGQVCAPEMDQPALRRSLTALIGKSFLYYDPTSDRYDLHELLRQFAAEKLAQTPEMETAARDRHSATYCAFLHEHTENWHSAQQLETLAAVTREADNIQVAWRWALAQGEWQRLVQAIDSWPWFHLWQGRFADGEVFCQAIVEKAERQSGETAVSPDCLRLWAKALVWLVWFTAVDSAAPRRLRQSLALLDSPALAGQDTRPERAFALLHMGKIPFLRANYEEARRLYAQSVMLYQTLGDQWGAAYALLRLGHTAANAGSHDEAKQLTAESLALFQALGGPRGITTARLQLGEIARSSGSYEEAKRLFTQILELSRAQGNLWGIKESLKELSDSALSQGEFEAGVRFTQQRVAISREIGNRVSLVMSLANLASAYCYCGNFVQAYSVAEEGMAASQDQRVSMAALYKANMALAEANMHLGRYKAARVQAEMALTLAGKFSLKLYMPWAQMWLGWAALAEEKYSEAHHFFQESLANFYTWTAEFRAQALAGLGRAAYGLGNHSEAQQHFVQALRTAVETQAFIPLLFLLPLISLLLADVVEVDQKERAVVLYALAASHPFVAKSRLLADIAGRHIATVGATLPPEVVEAARERGRALDMWETAAELLEVLSE